MLENLILMDAMSGKVFGCNIKPLYQELIQNRDYDGYRYIWAFKDPKKYQYLKKENPRLILVKYGSEKHKIAMARAKYIFVSSGLPNYYKRRSGQVYFQTWHGTPLKKLGCDIQAGEGAVFTPKEIHKRYRQDAKRMSYLLAPSEYVAEKLSSAFDLKRLHREEIIFREGYPRNDIFFKYTDQDINIIRDRIGIPKDKKVILYAPTFRDSDFERGSGYFFELPVSFEKLQEKFSRECVILFRPHVNIASRFDLRKYQNFVFNVASYSDISELYCVSDLLITDYSSVLFDYGVLKRPMIFYTYDFQQYSEDIRGLYISIEELPGEIALTEEELISAIQKQITTFHYDDKYLAFNEKFNPWDCAECSKRIIEKTIPKLGVTLL